jgi:GNAT superfamily N-acetyltransferase
MDPQTITLRPHRPGDIGWVIHRQATIYAQEYGYNTDFEALVATVAASFLTNFNPARDRCWISESNSQPVGHIILVQHPGQPHTAKLRLLLVESTARGTGLGSRLVDECIAFARQAGFHLVHEERHHSFGQDLIGQTWDLYLDPPPPGTPSHMSARE